MLTLFHDYLEPASAVAVARVDRLIAQGVTAEVVGLETIGVDLRLPVPADVAAAMERVAQEAAGEGLTLRLPPFLPPTALAHVVGEAAANVGAAAAWRQAVYAALWERGEAIDDPCVLRQLGRGVGLGDTDLDAALAEPGRVAALRRRTARLRRDGVGGVPTILAHRTLVPGLLDDDDLDALAALS